MLFMFIKFWDQSILVVITAVHCIYLSLEIPDEAQGVELIPVAKPPCGPGMVLKAPTKTVNLGSWHFESYLEANDQPL